MAQARNSNAQLRLLGAKGEREAANREATDHKLGGGNLDWDEISSTIAEGSHADQEWSRLADLYGRTPDRFREADRQLVTAWCVWVQRFEEANDAIAEDGLFVAGQSKRAQAAGLIVRHPAFAVQSQATNQLRFLGQQLGFSPHARKSAGIVEKEETLGPGEDLLSG